MTPQLRPYQSTAIGAVRDAVRSGARRVLLRAPTGCGKTLLASAAARSAYDKGNSVLILCPRRELVLQFVEALAAFGIRAGIIMAGHPPDHSARVQVASTATLHRRQFRPTGHVVVVDEAHLSPAPSIRGLIEQYPDAKVLGLTATPARGDGRGLGALFDTMVEGPSVADLTRDGYLVPVKYYGPSTPDLEGVKVRGGDYVPDQLAERMDRPQLVGDVVSNWLRLASDRQTVVFASSIRHSVHLRDRFLEAGVAAEHLDANTPADERAAILRRLATGETQVLCNVFVLTYGWDAPPVSCAVVARPTKSVVLWHQMVGRVLRTFPGKSDALVLDHGGVVSALGFADDPVPWSLDGSDRVQERRKQQKERGATPKPITCAECKCVFSRRADCPECGHRIQPKARPVNFIDGDLAELSRTQRRNARTFTLDEKANFYAQLLHIARERGYRDGWVAWKYREKFGVWPNHPAIRDTAPMRPTPEVASWVRGTNIRAAKERQKQQEAAA